MTDFALPSLVDLLAPDERAVLVSLGRRAGYRDGSVVHQRGDMGFEMGVVVAGQIKLVRQTHDGRQFLLATIMPGQHFADLQGLERIPRTHTGIAVGETVIDHYPPAAMAQLCGHAGILRALYYVSLKRLDQALEVLSDVLILAPEVRLAKLLYVMGKSANWPSQVACSHEELASLLGVSAMTLAKAFRVLRHEGLVETGYRRVLVADWPRIDAWVARKSE